MLELNTGLQGEPNLRPAAPAGDSGNTDAAGRGAAHVLTHERVLGPVSGYHLAVYACPVGDFGERFVGYHKLCRELPSSFFDAHAIASGSTSVPYLNSEAALDAAEDAAVAQLATLPPVTPDAAVGALSALLYVSRAVKPLGREELAQLLQRSRSRNQQYGVTGVLLHHDGEFMQYLEGPQPQLEWIWRTVRKATVHTGMVQVYRMPLARREFAGWSMAYATPAMGDSPALGVLAPPGPHRWLASDNAHPCLAMLRSFWARAGGAL